MPLEYLLRRGRRAEAMPAVLGGAGEAADPYVLIVGGGQACMYMSMHMHSACTVPCMCGGINVR